MLSRGRLSEVFAPRLDTPSVREMELVVCAADLARRVGDASGAARYLAIADSWARSVQAWTATSNGPYAPRPYYLRLTKDRAPDRPTTYGTGDSGPSTADHRAVADPTFLELVRLGSSGSTTRSS